MKEHKEKDEEPDIETMDGWQKLALEIKKQEDLGSGDGKSVWRDRQTFFLAAIGIKKVTAISTNITRLDSADESYIKKQNKLENFLDNAGMVGNWHWDCNRLNLVAAREKSDLDEFEQSFGDEIKRGILLGYPKTACEACQGNTGEVFNTEKSPLLTSQEQDRLLDRLNCNEGFKNFLQIRLSRLDYENELMEMKKQYKLCQKYGLG